MTQPQQIVVHPYVAHIFSRGIGMLLLALWCIITGLIQIGVPLGALAPILGWLLAAAGLLLLLGV